MILPRRERVLVVIEAFTVGLPFCVFKGVCGARLTGTTAAALGWALIAWGAADAVLNAVNALMVGVLGRRLLPVCCLQAIAVRVLPSARGGDVGTALDAVLSFSLVAVMIGSGSIAALPRLWLTSWNLAVVLNVLGAGALRFAQALGPQRAV
jgi:hypothetical protein